MYATLVSLHGIYVPGFLVFILSSFLLCMSYGHYRNTFGNHLQDFSKHDLIKT